LCDFSAGSKMRVVMPSIVTEVLRAPNELVVF